jgi:hypothetical protein
LQMHLYLLTSFWHVAPFMQGLLLHSSTSGKSEFVYIIH